MADPRDLEQHLGGRRLSPRKGQTNAETGSDADTGMPPDRRETEEPAGAQDTPEGQPLAEASKAQSPSEDYPGDTPSDAAPADRTTL